MKTTKLLFTLSLLMGFLMFVGCKKEEEKPTFTLVSLTADGIDLAGVTSATDVPEDADIIAVFSSAVDGTTASNTTIAITDQNSNAANYTVSVDGETVTLSPTNGWDGGSQYTIELSNTIAGTNGAEYDGNTLTFRTSGIFVPNKDTQVLHLSFDDQTATDETGTHTVSTVGTLGFDTDRRGTANAAAYFDGSGNLVEVGASEDLIEGSITISYWFNTNASDYDGASGSGIPQTRFLMGLGVERGYFLEVGRRSNDHAAAGYSEFFLKYATNQINIGENSASVPEATAWTEVNKDNSVADFGSETVGSGFDYVITALQGDATYVESQAFDGWTQIVMVIDGSAQTKTIYVNGEKWVTYKWKSSGFEWLFSDLSLKDINNDGSPLTTVEGSLALGFAGSSDNEGTSWANYTTTLSEAAEAKKFFKGAIDEFRIFSMPFSDSDVATLYNNEK